MMRNLFFLLGTIFFTFTTVHVHAHAPFIEWTDFSEENPFYIRDSVENSKAVYAWFETGDDIDVYTFEVKEPVRLLVNSLVPVCKGYEELLPWFAVIGPGLPEIEHELPFKVPEGYGGYVVENFKPGEKRDSFYEFVTRKSYYKSPVLDMSISQQGRWYIYFWDPHKLGGDYVAVIGIREVFTFMDIIRTIIYAPLIMLSLELHIDCETPEEVIGDSH